MSYLHDMELGGESYAREYEVVRVPGGWIFKTYSEEGSVGVVFVPYSEEFKVDKEEK